MSKPSVRVRWPWRDQRGRMDWLKAGTLALMFYPSLWTVYQIQTGGFGPLVLVGMIYWSGVWATALLLLALFVSPASKLLGWRRLVTARRIMGVSALLHTIAHIIIYFALYRWNFDVILRDMVTRPTLVVASISTVGLIALGATSFDDAVRWLGWRNWKRLHRTNYVLTTLAVVHYLLSPGIFSMQYVLSGILFWLLAWRWLERHDRGTNPGALAALAVIACIFTVLLEAGWMWVYHDVDPMQPLGDNFSLVLGVAPAWQVLAFGLITASVPLLSTLRRRAQAFAPKR